MHTTSTDQAGSGDGARRRRPVLASLTTLGVLTGLLGVAGVFAAGSDTADTGANDVVSGDTPAAVDLVLAPASYDQATGEFTCGEFADDLTTGVITSGGQEVDGQYPGVPNYDEGQLCVRNLGTSTAALALTAFDLVDQELGCSPDEAEADESCGTGVGELSRALYISAYHAAPDVTDPSNCLGQLGQAASPLDGIASGGSLPLGTINAGETRGVCLGAAWDQSDLATQSDQASWRFRFEGAEATEPPPPSCDDDGFEENDDFGQAVPVAGTLDGMICSGDDDYFSIQHGGGTLVVSMTYDHSVGDLDLEVLDASGARVGRSEDIDGDEQVASPAPAGTYIVRVYGYEGDAGAYTLTTPVVIAPPPGGGGGGAVG